jgi:hypothetical protein
MKHITRAEWIEALRSGRYRQAEGVLKDEDGAFCCLGVACDLAGVDLDLPYLATTQFEQVGAGQLYTDLGLHYNDCNDLAELNDSGAPFTEIASAIEELVFKRVDEVGIEQ